MFLLSYFDLNYILLDTTSTGGDVPAHNYLASHLKESFLKNASVISWAKGWWCGFPMYQYYFFFPYLITALLSLIIPINIAFKIVSISGILFLPSGMYFSLKWMKFKEPAPLLCSIAMIPFLFVDTHNMWGVNIYSTLAGEISNSVSFVFFVLFLGSLYRDLQETQFRIRTVILLTFLFYSHFFTTIIALFASFVLLFLFDKNQFKARIIIYIKINLITFLLISWWIIPLLVKLPYSVEFGGDWNVEFFKTFPKYTIGLIPFAVFAVFWGVIKKQKNIIFIIILLGLSILAFYNGTKFKDSFTNIRFWPFIFLGIIILSTAGIGYLVQNLRYQPIFVIIILISILAIIEKTPNNVKGWAKWNYEGVEKKNDYQTFRDLIMPLDNTPGRLANDLHAYNDHFGSTRIFECIPYLINKDILEGGIVNSSATSMFSYYIQCETSDNCAGFPTIVNPTSFNIDNATKHLKLANVKHFIAHSDRTKNALLNHPEWKLLKTVSAYKLFELESNDGHYVYIPKNMPIAVKTDHWKENVMEWIYTIEAIETPIALIYKNNEPLKEDLPIISEEEYFAFLSSHIKNNAEVPIWLNLGPFYFSCDIPEEKAIDLNIIDIKSLNPKAWKKDNGLIWKPILRRGPIFVDGLYKVKYYFLCYNYVNIYSKENQKVLLHYSNDDHAAIYLNNEIVLKTPFTGLNNYKTKEVELKQGFNSLIYKLEQGGGGVFFHLKITDLNNKPLDNISYSISPKGYEFKTKSIDLDKSDLIFDEKFGENEIKFKTKAINMPHIIKCSYFPNWKVRGAKHIYHVSPNFMLVYPEQEEVTLYYGSIFF